MSKEISLWFPSVSEARIRMVFTSPSQVSSGITSSGTPEISPAPKITLSSPDTSHPTGRLSTMKEIVLGELPVFSNKASGYPPSRLTTHSPNPVRAKSWVADTLSGNTISERPVESPSLILRVSSTALP